MLKLVVIVALAHLLSRVTSQEMEVTFSSKRQIGSASRVAQPRAATRIITESEPERAVSFSSKRQIGGNVQNVAKNKGTVSFSSARSMGLTNSGTNEALEEARDAKSGVSFSSARQIGTFASIKTALSDET